MPSWVPLAHAFAPPRQSANSSPSESKMEPGIDTLLFLTKPCGLRFVFRCEKRVQCLDGRRICVKRKNLPLEQTRRGLKKADFLNSFGNDKNSQVIHYRIERSQEKAPTFGIVPHGGSY